MNTKLMKLAREWVDGTYLNCDYTVGAEEDMLEAMATCLGSVEDLGFVLAEMNWSDLRRYLRKNDVPADEADAFAWDEDVWNELEKYIVLEVRKQAKNELAVLAMYERMEKKAA